MKTLLIAMVTLLSSSLLAAPSGVGASYVKASEAWVGTSSFETAQLGLLDLEVLGSQLGKGCMSSLKATYEAFLSRSPLKAGALGARVRGRLSAMAEAGMLTAKAPAEALARVQQFSEVSSVGGPPDSQRDAVLSMLGYAALCKARSGAKEWHVVAGEAAYRLNGSGYESFVDFLASPKAKLAPADQVRLAKSRELELRSEVGRTR